MVFSFLPHSLSHTHLQDSDPSTSLQLCIHGDAAAWVSLLLSQTCATQSSASAMSALQC